MTEGGEAGRPVLVRFAAWLVSISVPRGLARDGLLGDLAEEYAAMLERRGRRAATWWYVRSALGAAVRYAASPGRVRSEWRTNGMSNSRERRMRTDGPHYRVAVRRLTRSPMFTLSAVVLLAVGIGANAMVFHMVDSVLLRPLTGVEQPEQLLDVGPGVRSYPFYLDVRDAVREVADVAAFRVRQMAIGIDESTSLANVALVSGSYFPILGTRASRGRLLSDADDEAGSESAAVLSHAFYATRFASDPAVVGRVIRVNGALYTIVGVAAKDLGAVRLLGAPDLYVPITQWDRVKPPSLREFTIDRPGWSWLGVLARPRPGVSAAAASELLEAGAERHLLTQFPNADRPAVDVAPARMRAVPGRERVRAILALLWAVVGLVLLMAVANVACLVLARAQSRAREFGMRLALGARRGNLVAELLAESVILAVLAGGAAVGLLFAAAAAIARTELPNGLALGEFVRTPDLGAVVVVAVLSGLTAALVALIPAWSATGRGLIGIITGAARVAGGRPSHARRMLLVVQVALSLVLLVGTGLFGRALQQAADIDLGFEPDPVALATIGFELGGYDAAQAVAMRSSIGDRVAALPGVRDIAWTLAVPLTGGTDQESYDVPGRPAAPDERRLVEVNLVSPGFFRTLDVPILAGRAFRASDREGSLPVAIVNATMANRIWPGGDAIGGEVEIVERRVRVVGVVADMKYHTLDEPARPYLYLPLAQHAEFGRTPTLLARVEGRPGDVLPHVRQVITGAAPGAPLLGTATLGELLGVTLLPQRAGGLLLALFGAIALFIAAFGVYGVVALMTGQRTREIGIRAALGADPRALLRLVLRESVVITVAGIILGIMLGLAGTRLVDGLLYGISGSDPVTYVVMTLVLLGVAAVGAYLPARRALRIPALRALAE